MHIIVVCDVESKTIPETRYLRSTTNHGIDTKWTIDRSQALQFPTYEAAVMFLHDRYIQVSSRSMYPVML